MNRYKLFDQARGFAIIVMVMANSAPLLAENITVGFWFRLVSSFPAPMFVLVAGLMVALTASKHDFKYFMWRGSFVFGMGVLVDCAANTVVPCQSFDVLYLIGIMTPCAYQATKLKTSHLGAVIVFLFALSCGVQQVMSYQPLPLMSPLFGEAIPDGGMWPMVWHHWLVDGWFPLLPWLPVGLSGILCARFYQAKIAMGRYGFFNQRFFMTCAVLVAIGVLISWFEASPYYVRYGFVELFYPPTLGFIFIALGVVGMLLAVAEWSVDRFSWCQTLGSMTLTMYVLHLLIISHVLDKLFYPVDNMATFFMITACHLVILAMGARAIIFVRKTYTTMPLVLQWLLGK